MELMQLIIHTTKLTNSKSYFSPIDALHSSEELIPYFVTALVNPEKIKQNNRRRQWKV
jgi:hypothetical protein